MKGSLDQLIRGDGQAWHNLYRAISPGLYRFLLSRVGDPNVAQDVMQEGFYRLTKSLSAMKDGSSIKSWLYSTCYRLTVDWYRQNSSANLEDCTFLPDCEVGDPLTEVLQRESDEEILQAVMSLSDAHRTVVILRIWGELSYSEIRDITGLSEGTLRSQFYWAMRKLRRILRKDNDPREDVRAND